MSSYSVTARDLGGFSYEISNGRAQIQTAWNREEGKFLATELFLAGLGACMLATLMYSGQFMGLNLTGASVHVDAESATKPDRMVQIRVVYRLPAGLTDMQKEALVRAGNRCKVHETIESRPKFEVVVEEI